MPDLSTAAGILVLALIVLMTNPKSVEVIDAAVGEHADRYLEAKRLEIEARRKAEAKRKAAEKRRKMRTYSGKGARSSGQS